MHDIVIRGGTIMDGTGKAAFSGDVAIADGRITGVEHRDTGADPGLARQAPDFTGPHEAFLAHVLSRGVGGGLRPLQRRQQWCLLDQSVPLVST